MQNKLDYTAPEVKVIHADFEEIICTSSYQLRYPSGDKPATHQPDWYDESNDRYRSTGSQIWG